VGHLEDLLEVLDQVAVLDKEMRMADFARQLELDRDKSPVEIDELVEG
jgi:hypothetical protein